MQVRLYGTRGSTPGHPRGSYHYGGNTTCLQIVSPCVPETHALVVDAGSGFYDLSCDLIVAGVMNLALLCTHWHHDHTQGLCLAPHSFAANRIQVWGPEERGIGPKRVFEQLFRPPWFPVAFAQIADRFRCTPLKCIGTQVLVIHPVGGFTLLPLPVFNRLETSKGQVAFRQGRHDLSECLVVRMWKTMHPEYTVSYRFEERPTGRVFVFLTDQEKQAAMPGDLKRHLAGTHLLIMDAQYSEATYGRVAGFGHGTPEYCAQTALDAGVARLGLTHHDPTATDEDIDARVAEAAAFAGDRVAVFGCADHMVLDV